MTFIHLQTPSIFFKVSERVKEGMNTDDYECLLYKNTCSFHTERLQCSLNFILKYKLLQLSMLEIDIWVMPQFKPHALIPSITLIFHFEGKTLVCFFSFFVKEINSLWLLEWNTFGMMLPFSKFMLTGYKSVGIWMWLTHYRSSDYIAMS